MARYDLSISINYTSNWTIVEAVREIFQNCIDEEAQHSHEMIFDYDEENQELRIGNKGGRLEKRTLLLGITGKADDDSTIGMHGEGYKIATAVLLRQGYSLVLYNGNANETWEAKIIKSKKYGEDIVSFDISKSCANYIGETMFVIGGVTKYDFNDIVDSNIHLLQRYRKDLFSDMVSTEVGDIYKDEFFKGKIFVGGLYVCTNARMSYGYNFIPKDIKLDRDRNSIDEITLKTKTGLLIYSTGDIDFISSMLDSPECCYVKYDINNYKYAIDKNKEEQSEKTVAEQVGDSLVMKYKEKFGDDVALISDSYKANELAQAGVTVAYVSESEGAYIAESSLYEEPELPEEEKISDVNESLAEFITSSESLSSGDIEKLESILERYKKFE